MDSFLAAVNDYCAAHRKYQALADSLGVTRQTVRTWLAGTKWPQRARTLAIARWYRSQRQ